MSCKTCAAVRRAFLARMALLRRKRVSSGNHPPRPNPLHPPGQRK